MTRQEQLETLMALQTFDRNGKFKFRCTACGKCCKHREDILLNPFDLHRLSGFLGIPMGEVIQKYCRCHIGEDSQLPVVVMDMKGPERICPLLVNRKCSVHAAKPTVCALFPLGRMMAENGDQVRYLMQDVRCGARDQEQTVTEWLEGFDLGASEEWFRAWNAAIMPLVPRMRKLKDALQDSTMQTIHQAVLNLIYTAYTPDKDFMEQFQRNMKECDKIIGMAEAFLLQRG